MPNCFAASCFWAASSAAALLDSTSRCAVAITRSRFAAVRPDETQTNVASSAATTTTDKPTAKPRGTCEVFEELNTGLAKPREPSLVITPSNGCRFFDGPCFATRRLNLRPKYFDTSAYGWCSNCIVAAASAPYAASLSASGICETSRPLLTGAGKTVTPTFSKNAGSWGSVAPVPKVQRSRGQVSPLRSHNSIVRCTSRAKLAK